jgi:NHLM bacteriocin system ABC transporter peptidase/ATP-binding protein
MEAVECGAAALGILMGYYKKIRPLEELRVECGVSRDGSKASNVVRAARKYGFEAKGFKKNLEDLREMTFPLILFWNFNHFVVLEGFKGDTVFINDPGSGPRTVTYDELDVAFTGVVLDIKPGEEFEPGGSKSSMMGALVQRGKGSKLAMAFLIIAGLSLVIPGLVVPIFTKIFVDNYLVAGQSEWVKPLLLGMLITLLIRGALTWIKEYYLIRLETKLSVSESGKFLWHVLHLPVVFYGQRSAGDISARVDINDKVAKIISRDLASATLDIIMVGFFAILMLFYDVLLTAIGITIAVINILVLKFVSRKRKDANMKLLQDTGKLLGTSMNGLMLIETLKASGGEADFFSKWGGYQAKVINAIQEMGSTSLVLSIVPALLTSFNTVLILCVGGLRVMDGILTMGALVAFQSLMQSFITPVNNLVGIGGKLQELEGDMNRLDDVLKHDLDPGVFDAKINDLTDETSAGDAMESVSKLDGYLEIKDLSFGYSKLAPPLIEGFSLSVKPGMRVALIGSSGCGKSTIGKLVMGLYQPWDGEILFDNKPRSDIPREVVTNSLSMVDQDISMFEGTIREGLAMWDGTIPEGDIIRAAKDACIHDVIAARRNGYDSDIEEGGGNFSGGQLQRLEIARALVNTPRIVVLDEATSALDPVTEMIVDDNLRRRGCTCLIVAHRLSTIRDCDEIIVMHQGKIVQRGKHDDLKDVDGLYSELIKMG